MSEKIYCIGDSHVSFFSGIDKIQALWPEKPENKLPLFSTFRLGAVLADGLTRYGSTMKGRELVMILLDRGIPVEHRPIPPGAKLMFCFGEIDCRFHLQRQAEKHGKSISEIAVDTASRYCDLLLEIQKLGYEILVWNVIPPTSPSHINPEYPHSGTIADRIEGTLSFNKTLKERSGKNSFTFVDIYDKISIDGGANMQFYMDEVHLGQKAMPFVIDVLAPRYPSLVNPPAKEAAVLQSKKSLLDIFRKSR